MEEFEGKVAIVAGTTGHWARDRQTLCGGRSQRSGLRDRRGRK